MHDSPRTTRRHIARHAAYPQCSPEAKRCQVGEVKAANGFRNICQRVAPGVAVVGGITRGAGADAVENNDNGAAVHDVL